MSRDPKKAYREREVFCCQLLYLFIFDFFYVESCQISSIFLSSQFEHKQSAVTLIFYFSLYFDTKVQVNSAIWTWGTVGWIIHFQMNNITLVNPWLLIIASHNYSNANQYISFSNKYHCTLQWFTLDCVYCHPVPNPCFIILPFSAPAYRQEIRVAFFSWKDIFFTI